MQPQPIIPVLHPSYWLSLDVDTHLHLARILRDAEGQRRPLTIETRHDLARGVSEVLVYCPDHPGLFARLQLLGSGRYQATLLDERAIGTDQSKKFVYVVDDKNTVQYRAVDLGGTHDGLRVIRDGIQPGERVIVAGQQRVHPGVVVAAHEEPAPQPTADARDAMAFAIN